ncbi:MAG: cytochrome c oxidase assembly protein [Gammaproteobacteria bacterium]|nr:cytochrome c oxidase assembly protein [Gammaproteobacteria bacterium]
MQAPRVAEWAPATGAGVLAAVWLGPLPPLASELFAAHMAMHIAVVCVAAPLIAVGLAASRFDPVDGWPLLFSPLSAALIELVVVWGWHAPGPHEAARSLPAVLALEQATFLGAGLLLWLSVLGGDRSTRRERAGVGILGLLMTSMHMTLLGVLLTLSPRVLYHDAGPAADLDDQRLGGLMMLIGGGTVYLIGGLMLLGWLLRPSTRQAREDAERAAARDVTPRSPARERAS